MAPAADFTVDETKTAFAKWKAFSSSAVDAGIDWHPVARLQADRPWRNRHPHQRTSLSSVCDAGLPR
jgi:hypothetical protein